MKCKKNYCYEGIWYFNNTTHIFRVMSNDSLLTTLWVSGFDFKEGIATVNFARRLAKYLQVYISNGNNLNHINYNLIPFFDFEETLDFHMINYAIQILSECWIYGKKLRKYWFKF